MNDPLQAMFQAAALRNTLFPPTSRYHGLATDILETTGGKTVIFLKRRFLPQPEKFELLQEHAVTEGERLDNITALYFSDPQQFWRLCDANRVLRPEELTETLGRRLRITAPEGLPGVPNVEGN